MREFLAIPLPTAVRTAAGRAASHVAHAADGWRLTREEGLHATIRFLGEVEANRQQSIETAFRSAAAGTGLLRLRLSGASVFPSRGRPRVLAFLLLDDTPEGALARLADRIEQAARAEGFEADSRRFSGHVTVARARSGARVAIPAIDRIGEVGAFVGDRLILFSSEPDRGGSRYREIASFPLAAKASS